MGDGPMVKVPLSTLSRFFCAASLLASSYSAFALFPTFHALPTRLVGLSIIRLKAASRFALLSLI